LQQPGKDSQVGTMCHLCCPVFAFSNSKTVHRPLCGVS
jgi:hypothetical protein